jgi:hypothetical protein
MFESLEQRIRFGKSARRVLVSAIARWTAAALIAFFAITSALEYLFATAEIQAFLSAFLHAE